MNNTEGKKNSFYQNHLSEVKEIPSEIVVKATKGMRTEEKENFAYVSFI